jgi:molybdopterin-binding protein
MRFSRSNALKGKVKNICHGAVNTEVILELKDGQELMSIMSTASAVDLSLKEGSIVYAVLNPADVMLGVE